MKYLLVVLFLTTNNIEWHEVKGMDFQIKQECMDWAEVLNAANKDSNRFFACGVKK